MDNFYPIKSKKELELFICEEKKAYLGSGKITLEKKLRNPNKLFFKSYFTGT